MNSLCARPPNRVTYYNQQIQNPFDSAGDSIMPYSILFTADFSFTEKRTTEAKSFMWK